MASNFNKVYLMGNLTRDPELRITPKGTAICQFGLAVNRQFKDESGTVRDETTFVDVEAWSRQAETISKYLVKGRPIFIEGRLKLDQWEDKTTGQKRNRLKVVLESFQFIGGKTEESAPTSEEPRNEPQSRRPAQQRLDGGFDGVDEDVPF